MTRALLTALLLALAASAARAAVGPKAAKPDPALELERFGKYDEAAALRERELDEDPTNVTGLKNLMWTRWNARRFEEARDLAQKVLALDPRDVEAADVAREAGPTDALEKAPLLREKATAAWRAGEYDAAIGFYRQVLELMPNDYLSLRDLMWALWRRDDIEGSFTPAKRILVLRAGDKEAAELLELGPKILEERRLAAIYARVKFLVDDLEFDRAVKDLHYLRRMRPQRWEYLRELVYALREAERYDEALAEADKLVAIRPADPGSWAMRGTIEARMDKDDEARRDFEKSLSLDPDQPRVELELAVLEVRAREFERAAKRLFRLEKSKDKMVAEAAPWPLGQALFWLGRLEEALRRFDATIKAFPDRDLARYYRGWTLLKLDRVAEGRKELEALVAKRDRKALELLLDDAVARHEDERAITLGLDWVKGTVDPLDEGLMLRIASMLRDFGRLDEAVSVLNRLLAVVPQSQGAWVAKGVIALQRGDFGKARHAAYRARAINPAAREPEGLLADSAAQAGNAKEALRRAEQLLRRDPAEPENALRAARSLYRTGRRTAARKKVKEWLARFEKEPALAALLYHGLAEKETDPMLGYRVHQSTRTFEAQMKALADAGYTAVTVREVADWLAGRAKLPPKPVLITFDDARADSFRADPILERHGFKATMMAALANVDGKPHPPPGYAGWDTLKRYADTGRWEIESHGDQAHAMIPMDAKGRRGLFLVNRKVDEKGVVETEEAWKLRVAEDLAEARRRIEEKLGRAPIAFAFPDGADGRKADISNAPSAFDVDREAVKRVYALAFVEDDNGLNGRDRDPYALGRLEPSNRWSGADLVRHLSDHSPQVEGYATLLGWAAEEHRYADARSMLEQLRAHGASPSLLFAKEAAIRYYAGDIEGAKQYAQKALQEGENKEASDLLARIAAEDAPAWRPGFELADDNQGRRMWATQQRFDFGRFGTIRPRATYRRGDLTQTGEPHVTENAIGAGAEIGLGDGHSLSLDLRHHLFSGAAPDFTSFDGSLASRWPWGVTTRVEGSRSLLYTARAASHGVSRRGVDGRVDWVPGGPWTAGARAQTDWYSDLNTRRTLEGEVGRDAFGFGRLLVRGIYRFVYDDADHLSADYYAPQALTLHALGPEVSFALNSRTSLSARYLPARGKESGFGTRFVNQGTAALVTRWRETDFFQLSFDYSRTPSYRALDVRATAGIRF